MFTNISWAGYLTVVAILLPIYYLYVGVRYFSADLKTLFAERQKLKFKAAPATDSKADDLLILGESRLESPSFEETTDDEFAEVEHLIERLKAVIADASRRKLIPQEFRQYLRLVLKEYPTIRYSPLRSSINELIISECEKYGTVTLKEAEVELLWKEAV